jgi:hypothetical protein
MEREKKVLNRQRSHRGTILVRVEIQKLPVTLDCGSLGKTVSCDNSICKSLEKDYSEADTRELEVVSDVSSWHLSPRDLSLKVALALFVLPRRRQSTVVELISPSLLSLLPSSLNDGWQQIL